MTATVTDIAGSSRRNDPSSSVRTEAGSAAKGALGAGMSVEEKVQANDIAFDAILSLAATLQDETSQAFGAKTSPAQMFEAGDGNSSQSRASRQSQQQSVSQQMGASRYDRTSIEARQMSTSANADVSAKNTSLSTPSVSQDLDHAPEARGSANQTAARLSAAEQSRTVSTSSARSDKTTTHSSQPSTTVAADIKPNSASAAPSVQAAEPGTKSSAQRVATILATGKVGSAEGPRSEVTANQSAPTNASASEKKSASPQSKNSRLHESSTTASPKRAASSNQSTFDELVRSIRLRSGFRESSARIQLNPPELGRLDVDVKLVDERVEITVRTESSAARHLVQSRGMDLTHALEQQGVGVDRFEVTSEPSSEEGAFGEQESRWESATQEHYREPSETVASSEQLVQSRDESDEWSTPDGPQLDVVAETRLDVSI